MLGKCRLFKEKKLLTDMLIIQRLITINKYFQIIHTAISCIITKVHNLLSTNETFPYSCAENQQTKKEHKTEIIEYGFLEVQNAIYTLFL